MRARLRLTGPDKIAAHGVIDDRDDGLSIRLDLLDPPRDWTITAVTVTSEPSRAVTAEDLSRVGRELPVLTAVLAALMQAERTAAVAASGETGDELARVAGIYERAVESHQRPVLAVMQELNLSRPTANRRIRAAKDLGLLPERVGELR